MEKILTPHNFLPYYLIPNYFADHRLSESKIEAAMSLANRLYQKSVYLIVKYHARQLLSRMIRFKTMLRTLLPLFGGCLVSILTQRTPIVK